MMNISLYTATIQPFIKALGNLSNLLDKGAEFAESKHMSIDTLMQSRLAPDQFPLIKQVQLACDQAKSVAPRLNGEAPVSISDNDKTLKDLKGHVDKTIELLMAVKPEDVNGKENAQVTLPRWDGKTLNGLSYVVEYAIPNFYFHVVTAYAIMRHNGVDLGKADYIGGLQLLEKA